MNPYLHIQDHTLISYEGREESVLLPPGIHTIGEGAFKACVSLKKVILPQGLCRIMPEAFKGCRQLEEIVIPEGVTEIGDYGFHRCHHLREISLPASVERLGDCVFLYCDSLTRIRMPGVKRLGKQAFVNDVLLQELEISRELREEDICDVFTGCGKISRIAFSHGESFSFPNAVELVAGEMAVPSLIRTIALDILRMMELEGRQLVKFLTNLKHVEIPEGIEVVKKSCFFDKRGILSVKLPASLQRIESRAFRNCIGLETLTFRNDQVEIQEDAFQNCTALRNVNLPGQAPYTFQGILDLQGPQIPPLVEQIHRQVMGNFQISGTILLKYLGSESRVAVPEGITIIGEEAFRGNEALDRVILPESLTEIGAGAFRDCLVLQRVDFPKHLTRIGAGAFENCVKLIRALLPLGLTAVADSTFRHCHLLREVAFGPCLREIGDLAFYHCPSLKKVTFPESLERIGKMAFCRCGGLTEIRLLPALRQVDSLAFAESGVKKVWIAGEGSGFGTGIFSYCPRLQTLVLEEGLRHIPHKLAFRCGNLKRISVPKTLESVGRHPLEQTPFLEQWIRDRSQGLPFPDDILWDGSYLSGEVSLPEEIRIVAGGAFYGNSSLTQVHFSESVTWIGAAAFKGCEQLSTVIWPSGLLALEEEMFSGCLSLEQVLSRTADTVENNHAMLVPAGFRTIGDRGFSRCFRLKRLNLELTESLGKEALLDCRALLEHQELSDSGTLPDSRTFPGSKALLKASLKSLVSVGERSLEGTCFANPSPAAPLVVLNQILLSGQKCTGEICLPQGIRAIAPYAFSGNESLTRVVFPETLCEIGEGAFWGCRGLIQVEFSHTPCRLGSRAFEKCIHLQELRLSAREAGAGAFAWCSDLVRAEIHGLSILEKGLFEGCSSLEVCLSPQAEEIWDFCFSGCGRLETLDLSRIRKVGSYGFQNCDSLTSLQLGESVTLLPHAFQDCGTLEEVKLSGTGGGLCLREYAFSGCTALTRVTLWDKDWQRRHYQDLLSPDLPQIVRQIFSSALSCFLVEKERLLKGYRGQGRILKIPEGIERIEAEVFRDILMLEQVEFPDTLEEIGARAFHGTAWLEQRRRENPLVMVKHMLLDGSCCQGEIRIPPQIRLVCGWAFAGGLGIQRIRFLSPGVKVGEYAFRNCINLREMVLADGTLISFGGISDRQRALPPVAKQAVMDRLNCFKTDENDILVECTGNISHLRIPEGITAIGDHVFQDGNLLTTLRLSSTVTSIGKSAFAGCRWLKSLEQGAGVERIEAMAFSGCGRLEQVELSENLRFLGIRAFENCTSLREIHIPEGVEEIPDRAFFRCHSLEEIVLPSTLKRIGKEAFAFCKNLRRPLVKEEIAVGERAFTGIREPKTTPFRPHTPDSKFSADR